MSRPGHRVAKRRRRRKLDARTQMQGLLSNPKRPYNSVVARSTWANAQEWIEQLHGVILWAPPKEELQEVCSRTAAELLSTFVLAILLAQYGWAVYHSVETWADGRTRTQPSNETKLPHEMLTPGGINRSKSAPQSDASQHTINALLIHQQIDYSSTPVSIDWGTIKDESLYERLQTSIMYGLSSTRPICACENMIRLLNNYALSWNEKDTHTHSESTHIHTGAYTC